LFFRALQPNCSAIDAPLIAIDPQRLTPELFSSSRRAAAFAAFSPFPDLMTKLRTLIVDDEPLARERLRALLGREAALEIIGECGNGHDAVATISSQRPDIVFLDMQMPGGDGLDVVKQLPPERPAIIFVTAHERFAVEAFAADAVDYLLKPFDSERLRRAVERAAAYVRNRLAGDLGERLTTLLADAAARKPRETERIAIRADGRVLFLKRSDIVWVEAANNYCIVHLADAKRLMLRDTLSSLEERLGVEDFTRINRSALVNIDQVKELQPSSYGDYVVVLRDGLKLSLSRSLRGRLAKLVPTLS
jgi:two-component system LytT family response regulator